MIKRGGNMNILEISLKALVIFNFGINYVIHYANSDDNQKERLKISLRGTIGMLETLLAEMDE